jgi:hypothetical protein
VVVCNSSFLSKKKKKNIGPAVFKNQEKIVKFKNSDSLKRSDS